MEEAEEHMHTYKHAAEVVSVEPATESILCNLTGTSMSSMLLARARRLAARPLVGCVGATSTACAARPAGLARFRSSQSAANSEQGVSPSLKIIGVYVGVSLAVMASIARYKNRDAAEEEGVRVYNMAKRAVVKDRRFFEAIGYPKDFEIIRLGRQSEDASVSVESDSPADAGEGSFRVSGDKGTAVVTYKQGPAPTPADADAEKEAEASKSDHVTFDLLHVQLEDGRAFSALDSYLKKAAVAEQQKSETLGKKMALPMVGGVVIGGLAAFFVIRILRNRPSYVHKLALDCVNNSEAARALLGHPITSNRKDYVGALTHAAANYSISCRGPKAEGTLIVKAFKDETPAQRDEREAGGAGELLATPGTAWKFSTLVLSVKRNNSQREKNAKVLNLLANSSGGGSSASAAAGGGS
ncbi:hypothetical protein PybrP1_004122, partial [[Pythium] brassicae (nom. inval.)]